MLNIVFTPETSAKELVNAAHVYSEIWKVDGEKMVNCIENFSGLRFSTTEIYATVKESMSQSHPMILRASYDDNTKRGTLIHELCHVLCVDNNVRISKTEPENYPLEVHKIIDLILYDIWIELYGENFAKVQVVVESERRLFYKQAFDWALSFTKAQRAEKFKELTASFRATI